MAVRRRATITTLALPEGTPETAAWRYLQEVVRAGQRAKAPGLRDLALTIRRVLASPRRSGA